MNVAQSIFGQNAVAVLAKDETDGRIVLICPQLIIHHTAIEIHFAGIVWFERPLLEFDDNVGPEFEMIKEKVDVIIVVANFDTILPTHKGKTLAEFNQKFFQMFNQIGF